MFYSVRIGMLSRRRVDGRYLSGVQTVFGQFCYRDNTLTKEERIIHSIRKGRVHDVSIEIAFVLETIRQKGQIVSQ